ncbi:hypothetical protein BpHYR1_042272 [Brachionus plicatilis]|uniref:UPAR/Ly6 domain-containing protein n=1 Tax=Brachionus plicatilis TaxID=10195 RepID=A0A3M7R5Z2_BRAPC|nr:hypothetical protein BpHYR1_042272 [Brachionus plicatilis]
MKFQCFLLLILIARSWSLKCYLNGIEQKCISPLDTCAKIVGKINDKEIKYASCFQKSLCNTDSVKKYFSQMETYKGFSISEFSCCSKDLCNNGSIMINK